MNHSTMTTHHEQTTSGLPSSITEVLKDPHAMHAAALGGISAIIARKTYPDKSPYKIGLITAFASYFYMRKYGHTIPEL
jgi:hypothetical protein